MVMLHNPPVHTIGDTFYYSTVGPVTFGGEPVDMTGWTVKSELKGNGFVHALGCTVVIDAGHLSFVSVHADPGEQSTWRAGFADLVVRLIAPNGYTKSTGRTRIVLVKNLLTG